MIEVSHLTKQYGKNLAVSDLSFTIEPGQIYGFLGPNGAGKSTTMNIMTGCLAATSGEVKINGYDIFEQPMEAKKCIGYLPEQPPLYLDRTPREYLTFVAEAKGVVKSEIKSQIEHVMEVTQITDVADRICKYLSKGYKQRVGIAQALLGNPEIIILDEPTVGLDPRQIIEIRNLIASLAADHTVILSSHILSEVQAVCNKILIIAKGKLVAFDTAENLENTFAGESAISISSPSGSEEMAEILSKVSAIKSVDYSDDEDGYCNATITPETTDSRALCASIFHAFAESGKVLTQLSANRASLEDVFIDLTKEARSTGNDVSEKDIAAAAKEISEYAEEKKDDNTTQDDTIESSAKDGKEDNAK